MQRILFGPRGDWKDPIIARLDRTRYWAVFDKFDDVDFIDFDCVVPLGFEDYEALRRRPAGNDRCLLPAVETVNLCNSKLALNRFLIEAGLGQVVPTLYPDEAGASTPYIFKKTEDEGGYYSFIVHDKAEDAACVARMNGESFFRQQAIPGSTEWAAHFLAVNGQTRFATHVRYSMPDALVVKGTRAPPADITLMPNLELDPCLVRINRLLGYTGTGCANYKIVDGAPKLFEINPRFGWSLHLDINRYLDCYLQAIQRPRLQAIQRAGFTMRAS